MKIVISHLRDNDVSYFNHMKRGLLWSGRLALTSSALVVHSFLPFLFSHTASKEVRGLCQEMNGCACKDCKCEL
jgi:hypothetical protein